MKVGDDCLTALGCKFIDHDHGVSLDLPMNVPPGVKQPIALENNVWLGANVVVLRGVSIGAGAVVAAGAIVTKHIGANEIWAGVPAREIRDRL